MKIKRTGQRELEDGPKGTRGWAKESRRTGQREPEDRPKGTGGWIKGSQRTEASMGPDQ
ncbi:hypothetical protein K503DRAFT_778143, partial [Rhizopogon vinicolor AM-OR11-026]